MIEDAIVLAAGKGTRLLPITTTTPKPLLKICGREILYNILKGVEEAGIKRALIVVDYLSEKFYEFVKKYEESFSIDIELVSQINEKGTAKAIYSVKDLVDGSFLVASGDHVLDVSIYKEAIASFKKHNKGVVMLKEVEDPRNYGVAVLEGNEIKEMEEKPQNPKSNLSNIGIYVFENEVFEEIEKIKISPRGEYEITDVLRGKVGEVTKKYWIDVGYPWNVLDANKWLLSRMKDNREEAHIINSDIEGKIVVGENVKIINSVIEGDVFIGDNSVIGPFAHLRGPTSIGENCKIGNSTIKSSVLGDRVFAKHFCYVGDSVIGNNVNFGASSQIANLRFDEKSVRIKINGTIKDTKRKKFGAVIGDNVRIGVNSSIMPGKIIYSNAFIYPGSVVNRNVEEGERFKGL